MMRHTSSAGDSSGLQEAGLVPALFYYEATLFEHMQNVARHHLADISRDVAEEDAAWMAAYVVPKLFDMWTGQTTAHFSGVGQSVCDELGPRRASVVLGVVDIWLSLCIVEV